MAELLAFLNHAETAASVAAERGFLTGLDGACQVPIAAWSQLDGEHLTFTLDSEADLPAINRYLVEQGADVYAFSPQNVSLEELFIQIVGTDGGL